MRLPAIAFTGLLLAAVPAAAQTPPTDPAGTVRVIVHDPSDLPVPGAEVILTASDTSTLKSTTDDRGEARLDGLRPGVYSGRVTSAGFRPLEIGAFSIQPGGRVTRKVTLQVAGLVENIDVAPAAEDRQLMNSFTRQFTADQLEALPEDPEELLRVLTQLVGDDADIRVDGFKTSRLPLGTQIQDIQIRYDVGASSSGGGPRVEIQTRVGGDRWRNNAGLTMRDASWNARNPFSGLRPAGRVRQYSWNLYGPLVPDRTRFSLTIDGSKSVENQTIRAAAVGGLFSRLVEQPSDGIGFWTQLDHQIAPAQTIRLEVARHVQEADNQGIGEFDLPERGFTRHADSGELQIAHHATIGRRYVNNLRFSLGWAADKAVPISDARTIRVLDAFTTGGAQQSGGHRSTAINFEEEFELTVRRHHITTGVTVEGADYHGDEFLNASGTYTFSSLAAFEAGRPTTFTQRVGDPHVAYSMYSFASYIQDDYRVRPNLMINLGLRHDFQSHVRDVTNFSPRLGASWTPSSKTRTTVRASAGTFHSQMDAGIYEQLLLVDGLAQRDLVISNPGYPDPFSAGVALAAPPASIIRARTDLTMPFSYRYTVGVDQPIGNLLRFRGTWSHQTAHDLFRSRNANAPVDGVRPDASVGNVTELDNTARSESESVQTDVSVAYPPRRFSANVSYVFGRAMNETDGPFSLAPDSVDLAGEWGPSRSDVRHRVNIGLNSDLIGGFRIAANFRARSAPPYNITTGTDPNGDGVFNERPTGVTRNSGRGAPTKYLDLTLTWRLSLGQPRPENRSGHPGDQRRPAGRDSAPFRFEVFARATNVLNALNPLNFSGVLTSPFFGLPTSADTARRVALGTRVWF